MCRCSGGFYPSSTSFRLIWKAIGARESIDSILSAGECALVFPEGSRTPDGNLQPAAPGLGLLIAKTRARLFNANFRRVRRLADHGKIHLWRKITIVAGEPIYFSDADSWDRVEEISTRG